MENPQENQVPAQDETVKKLIQANRTIGEAMAQMIDALKIDGVLLEPYKTIVSDLKTKLTGIYGA